jgi:hypothetical protein
MTEDTFKRALVSAIRNAVKMGQQHGGRFAGEQLAQDYATALVLPIHEACVQQAIEEGYASARLAMPEGTANAQPQTAQADGRAA